ncbi:MAG: radical SAM protein [Patescibacteria group bacterium]
MLIEVCYTCNENCIHCCLSNHAKYGMTLKQYECLFDQLVEAGVFFIILTGGEPFTRHDFMKIVEAARKRRLSVTIFTNGTLLTENDIKWLKKLYVQEIHISIYSADPETHDNITRIRGSFQRSVENIKRLTNGGVSVKIKCPLMNTTVSGKDRIKKLAQNLGVKIQFTIVITAKDNGDNSTLKFRLTKDQLKEVLIDPDINSQSKKPIYFQNNLECIPCDTVLNGGSIDPYGDVYPCNQFQVKAGNVLESSFEEIWRNSLGLKELRNIRLRDLYECKGCDLFQFCTRCPGLALLEDKDLRGCSSAAKKVAEARKELKIYPTQSHIFSKI